MWLSWDLLHPWEMPYWERLLGAMPFWVFLL
ncbi:hypothetical protein CIB84_017620 [Bambusicola thoracicus]|uniref:Uncharacterized protein n=1 Tax=Bambusicola thoracicus TaxID=9083 RepID=A0A2P4S3E7_BAMTH|nr:hypothetical protein CIB84_017620 [Bambusicola thoracicus]